MTIYYNFYPLDICGLHRELPIIPLNSELAIASFNILGDVQLTNACAKALAERIDSYGIEILVGIEAKGIPLVHQIATLLGVERFVLIRKSKKVYIQNPLIIKEKSITTTGTQMFVLDSREAVWLKDKQVGFVDDVVSTGGSRRAVRHLIEQAGGTIAYEAYILKEGNWVKDQDDLFYLGKLPLLKPAPDGEGWVPVVEGGDS